MNKNASSPALKVYFFCSENQIEKITLEESDKPTHWEIVSNRVNLDLKSLIDGWMNEYCLGVEPKKKLPLTFVGIPPYTQEVLKTLYKLPFGKSLTYQELATLTRNPKAYRAVGSACSRNPFPLVIPCHRVVAKNSLGGFAFGLALKQTLLKFERII